ncbi:MAG: hypothetical protein Q9191_007005 [Dirinaria sp. TL-2023a]
MPDVGHGVSLLSQGTGYGIIIGLGILFAAIILFAVKIQKLYLMEDSGRSEMFMVANRSVGTGLTCSAVFSSWMWINETVFSSVVCYQYGLAAPMWFGTGLSFQIALMAVLGVLAKMRAPHAHTSLEIVRKRYGNWGHVIFTVLNLINNIFGCSSMILAGSQLVVGITGMHLAAATILIPVGVVLYTAVGGIKATFLTDFLHTTIAIILIIFFTLSVLTNEHVGGLGGLYDKVAASAADHYVVGNYAGSLLSFKSKGAIMFGLILKFGNLALVTMDTAFWQKSFASEVQSTVPGYDLAALAIFAVPWGLGTVFGLSARVIETLPISPTYPQGFTADEVASGFVMPYTIKALLGSGPTVGVLLLLFMAVTMSGWPQQNPFMEASRSPQPWSWRHHYMALESIASLFSPILYSVVISYFIPGRFDWREFLRIDLVEDETTLSRSENSSPDESVAAFSTPDKQEPEKPSVAVDTVERSLHNRAAIGSATPATELVHPLDENSLQDLRRWYKIAWAFLIFIIALTFIVWPMPLYRDYIFTRPFFCGWNMTRKQHGKTQEVNGYDSGSIPATGFQLEDHPIDEGRKLRVIVIGAGLSGILAGILLPIKVPGIELTILEKNADVVSLLGATS